MISNKCNDRIRSYFAVNDVKHIRDQPIVDMLLTNGPDDCIMSDTLKQTRFSKLVNAVTDIEYPLAVITLINPGQTENIYQVKVQ